MSCIPVTPDYLIKNTWTYEMIAEQVEWVGGEECPTYESSLEKTISALQNPKKKWFLLFDKENNKMGGFLDYKALDEESFEKVANGTFKDGELNSVSLTGTVCLYIGGFVIGKSYRKDSSNFKKLLAVFIESLAHLLKDGIVIKEIVVRGLTPLGQRLCEGVGMTKIIPHKDKGMIYGVSFEWDEKPKYATALYNAVKKTKAKRLLQELLRLDEKTGLPMVKEALQN
jgi:hypothetical protein